MGKWYQKATVQAALISALPELFTALVAIVAIMFAWKSGNNQLEQNYKLMAEKYQRDSLLVELQLKLVKKQFELDSLYFDKEITIRRKELAITELDKKLNILAEKANLQKLCNRIWEKLHVFFEDNNPRPQQPLKLGESRTTKFQSDLRISFEHQNSWAKELKELLYSGTNNRYLLETPEAMKSWKESLAFSELVIISTNAFIKKDMSWIEFYNFNKLYAKISDEFSDSYRILFN